MINCVIVENNPVCLNLIKHYVSGIAELNLVQLFTNASDATVYIHKNISSIDLVILNAEMPDLTGIELMATFKEFPCLVLMGSKENTQVKAFEHGAFTYLMKPLDYGKFLKAVEPLFIKLQPARSTANCIYAKENGVMTKVVYDDILYFETQGDYVKIHTKTKIHVVNSSMRNIEEKLEGSSQFIRIHRTYYININYLESFDSEVAIISNHTLPIGSKYRPELQSRLMII